MKKKRVDKENCTQRRRGAVFYFSKSKNSKNRVFRAAKVAFSSFGDFASQKKLPEKGSFLLRFSREIIIKLFSRIIQMYAIIFGNVFIMMKNVIER